MPRYLIVDLEGDARDPGCALLFLVDDVDDCEEAIRDAVREFYSSGEGRRVRRREGAEMLGWSDALCWIPEEVWTRHGLEPVRHPEVQRLVLGAGDEPLAELPPLPAP